MSGAVETSAARGRRLRLCIVAPSLEIVGGQAVQADRLKAGLREVEWLEVSFLPINPRLPMPLKLLQAVKYLRTLFNLAVYVATLFGRLWKYDVIHIFSASYFSFVLAPTPAILIGRLYGKEIVLNYHSGEAEDHLRRWKRTAIPTLRLADVIVVPSDYLVEVFGRLGLRALAIANSVEREDVANRMRPLGPPVFLANRNLERHYNVGCVLRAFAIIQLSLPEARLIVAGDGREKTRLQALAEQLGLKNVEFVGRVAPDEMVRLYDRATIYLNASNVDNMPLSIIEAFAAELPVVSTSAGGIPYVVEDGKTGLLVPRNDHESLAAAALRLVTEPRLAAQLVEEGRKRWRERYHWLAVRSEWLELYRSLPGIELDSFSGGDENLPDSSAGSVAQRSGVT
jgi:glycosyltransferase involved in cell wall biosynthesis